MYLRESDSLPSSLKVPPIRATRQHHKAAEVETRVPNPLSRPRPYTLTMSSQDTSTTYLQQMTSVAGSIASYMRLPVLVSSVLDYSYGPFF